MKKIVFLILLCLVLTRTYAQTAPQDRPLQLKLCHYGLIAGYQSGLDVRERRILLGYSLNFLSKHELFGFNTDLSPWYDFKRFGINANLNYRIYLGYINLSADAFSWNKQMCYVPSVGAGASFFLDFINLGLQYNLQKPEGIHYPALELKLLLRPCSLAQLFTNDSGPAW